MNEWQRASLDGVELEYRVVGAGVPVVLVHAGIFVDWFEPLLQEPSLQRYCLVTYHRVGYAGSSDATGPVSIVQQAAHLRSLLRWLEIERAHVVGHSSGASIAMQLALDSPGMVQSLALLEPAMPVPPSGGGQQRPPARSGMAEAAELYRAGDKAAAVDTFMSTVAGANYRAVLDKVLPKAFAQGVADADTFFGQELPAVQQWSFGREDAARISQPALVVMGAKSREVSPIWQRRQDLLTAWLAKAEPFVLDGATHLLHVQNSRDMAERLAAFLAAHPAQ